QLLGMEGVAIRALVDPTNQRWVRVRPEDPPQQVGEVGAIEAGELDPFPAATPLQFRQERHERLTTIELVAAVGQQDEDSLAVQVADEEAEQLETGSIGPVGILDDQDDGSLAGKPVHEEEQLLEE